MRRRLWILSILCLFLASPSQAAQQSASIQPEQQKITTEYFKGLGATFGCTKLVHAQFSTINFAELEYLPANENRYGWSKIMSVTVQTLPEDEVLVFPAMNGYNATLVQRYARHGELIDSQMLKSRDGMPVTYIEYKMGSGMTAERGVLVYGRHTPTMAALTKYVVNFGPIDNEGRATMKRLAEMLAAK